MARSTMTSGWLMAGMILIATVAFAGTIEIDPAVKGADLELAKKVKGDLDQKLGACASCKVTIGLKNGLVELSGVVEGPSKGVLNGVKSIPGVKGVSVQKVQTPSTAQYSNALSAQPDSSAGRKAGTPIQPGQAPKGAGEVSLLAGSTGADRKAPAAPAR